MHAVAALVGLALAALIVYLVFGSASQEGATQEGTAPGDVRRTGAALCGTVAPAEVRSKQARATALRNLPAIIDELGREVTIAKNRADQRAWFARVHAASGLCLDEIRVAEAETSIAMSTVDEVSEEAASRYAAEVLAAASRPPLHRDRVTLRVLVGEEERVVSVSRRAWAAFEASREELGLDLTIDDLARFRRGRFGAGQIRIVGWT